MSYFAEIGANNEVIRVLVGDNNAPNEGYDWFIENLGGTWVQTSYNATIRKNFAGVGFIYDSERDAFIPPKKFESWVLNEETCQWESPIPRPTEGSWTWDESIVNWVEIQGE